MTRDQTSSVPRVAYPAEEPGAVPFGDLVAAHYHPTPPEDVRDRIALPVLSPALLHGVVQETVRGFTRRPGRHNRYMPVPGELAVRTADLVDFLFCYGHEYRLTIFRAADIRTGSLLDVAAVHAEALRQGSACAWDWTGASDWLPPDAVPEDAAFVFWSAHTSLVDDARISAGFWVPGDGPPPAALQERTPFTAEQQRAMRERAAAIRQSIDPARVRHPLPGSPPLDPGLPVLVVERPVDPAGTDAGLTATEIRALVEHDGLITVVPRADPVTEEGA